MNGSYGRPGMNNNKGCTGMEAAWADLAPNNNWPSMNAMNAMNTAGGSNCSGCCGNSGWSGNYGGSGGGWDPAIGCYPDNRNDGCSWNGPEAGWGVGKPSTAYSQSMMMMDGMGEGGRTSGSGNWGSYCGPSCFNVGDSGNNGYSPNNGIGDEGGYMTRFGGADPDSDPIDFDTDGLFPRASAGDSSDPAMMAGFSSGSGMMANIGGGGMMGGGGGGGAGYNAAECGNPWLFQQQQQQQQRGGQFPF